MSLKKDCVLGSVFMVATLLAGCGAGMAPTAPPATGVARFALVANSLSNSISAYAIDSATGHLTQKNSVPAGGMNSRAIAVEPSGHFAYVGNVDSNEISAFAVDT